MDPLTVQYQCYNQRRIHYSWLFWACLALHIVGCGFVLIVGDRISFLPLKLWIYAITGASFLMALIAWRLHRQEIHYERLLRNIEEQWLSAGVTGIQKAGVTTAFSSRKAVILAMILAAIGLLRLSFLLN